MPPRTCPSPSSLTLPSGLPVTCLPDTWNLLPSMLADRVSFSFREGRVELALHPTLSTRKDPYYNSSEGKKWRGHPGSGSIHRHSCESEE